MATYLHPGVYVEEIPSGSKPIEGVATSVAAFIGYTRKGPLGEPVRITKYDDYKDQFGGVHDTGKESIGDPMGHSVLAFFQNGGTTTYIVRITRNWMDDDERPDTETKDAMKARGFMDHPSPAETAHAIQFTAVNEGEWANDLVATLVPGDAEGLYTLKIGREDEKNRLSPIETFSNVSLDSADPQYIANVVNGFSNLVEVALVEVGAVPLPQPQERYTGSSTSDDLSGLVFADELALSEAEDDARTLEITFDDRTEADEIVIEKKDYTTLQEVAEAIQKAGQGRYKNPPRGGFTAKVVGTTLVLTSGTRSDKAAVLVGDTPLAETLKLGLPHNGTETKGEAVDWASTEETALDEATLAGGVDGSKPGTLDYEAVFTAFVKYRDINIILLPGQMWSAGNPVVDAAIGHAESMKSRMVIVDPPVNTELTNPKQVNELGFPTSTYSVLYYPWVKVANPFYNPETNPGPPTAVLVPPSGFAAGMWSKIDARRGVWKAPAGVETGLLGVAGLQYTIEDGEQDVLNPLGVNALRARPGFGSVIWGTRTLSTNADPEWRYVPVRRTAIMIEQSIYNGIQWAVFEPNDHRLWSALRANIGGFMDGLFRSGAFQGEKASDAYFVRCRLGDTMTQDDIDAGRVIVIVGFAPLKPAEFVIVRIQQKVAQQ
jgi:phage tail sheath protein FI